MKFLLLILLFPIIAHCQKIRDTNFIFSKFLYNSALFDKPDFAFGTRILDISEGEYCIVLGYHKEEKNKEWYHIFTHDTTGYVLIENLSLADSLKEFIKANPIEAHDIKKKRNCS